MIPRTAFKIGLSVPQPKGPGLGKLTQTSFHGNLSGCLAGATVGAEAAFSALVGAMSLARAVSDEVLSHEILKTAADLLKNLA